MTRRRAEAPRRGPAPSPAAAGRRAVPWVLALLLSSPLPGLAAPPSERSAPAVPSASAPGAGAVAASAAREGAVEPATPAEREELGETASPAVSLPPPATVAAEPPRRRLELGGMRTELLLSGAAVLLVGVGEQVAMRNWEPERCRWCATNPIDDGARDALRWSADQRRVADRLSDVTAYVATPAVALGLTTLAAHSEGRVGEWGENWVVIAQAYAAAGLLGVGTKFATARSRPLVRDLTEEDLAAGRPRDDHLSFYSGHTNRVFALAVSAGTISSIRGYRWAPAIWGAGLAAATATGYLRIAADKHYLTDVLVGAATGSAVGFLVPWLRSKVDLGDGVDLAAAPTDGGGVVLVRWGAEL